jgi:RNA polymerase sigma factor (sigma-70 family)
VPQRIPRPNADPLDGFAALYRRFEAPVLAFALRRTRDPELAADLTAETFAAALRGWAKNPVADAEQAAWIFTIARTKVIDSWRRGQVEDAARRVLRMQPLQLEDPDLERIAALGDAPLTELLAALPDAQRRAVQARVLDERGYDDIAAELRCSEQVVRQRVSRGLAAIRTRFVERTQA